MQNTIMRVFIYCMTYLVMLVSFSCTPSHMDKQSLTAYLATEENGTAVSKESRGFNLTVTYRPTDLLIDQELGANYSSEKEDVLRKKYASYAYFTLQMEAAGRDVLYGTSINQADFNEKLQTMAFRIRDYVNLTTSAQDTIPVADYAFPRTFGLAKSTSMLFVFNREDIAHKEWASFNLNEFGLKAGDQRFRFKLSDLEKIPKLKFRNKS